jgi:hypothetical protein
MRSQVGRPNAAGLGHGFSDIVMRLTGELAIGRAVPRSYCVRQQRTHRPRRAPEERGSGGPLNRVDPGLGVAAA